MLSGLDEEGVTRVLVSPIRDSALKSDPLHTLTFAPPVAFRLKRNFRGLEGLLLHPART